ncbi:MAG: hypothetical protein ACKVXR_15510 [Planctomycetota bacterium]
MLGLAMQDKRIMQAIQACPEGVSILEWDPFQTELIHFINAFMSNDECAAVVRMSGLDKRDLFMFYAGGVLANMPDPFIQHGGPLVAPTLFFLDQKNIGPVLSDLAQSTAQQSGNERVGSAIACGAEMTEALVRSATAKRGKCTLPRMSREDYAAQQVGRKAMPVVVVVVVILLLAVGVMMAQ